ncbi:MAG: serine/threonine-protein kinase [Planctomycetota bacterium]|nr:serine/threonine-protein kinase [Planctomycetota bacterium]
MMIRSRQKLGKYRIGTRLAQGGFADVFKAYDTIEGVYVALKVPHPHLMNGDALEDFRREVRLTARLDHPNILPIKNADFINDRFVIVYALGERSLADRMRSRISLDRALDFTEEMLAALAHAHAHRVIHCDVKPDNLILFRSGRLRLTDFGIAKLTTRTVQASGSGTVGYVAPEQAMGKPSFRSDIFSVGLILYRMLAGKLPEWPYEWPLPGYDRLKRRLHPDLLALLRKSIEVEPYSRYQDARAMLLALQAVRARGTRPPAVVKRQRKRKRARTATARDWKTVQRQQFLHQHKRELATEHECGRCGGPVSEAMTACPWCGTARKVLREEAHFPAVCPRCSRGLKLDWRYCPWCYGGSVGPLSNREYSDVRYAANCSNRRCPRRELMPFMRYCPWCHTKVKRRWTIEGSKRCPGCGWGVLKDFWSTCPWCSRTLATRRI